MLIQIKLGSGVRLKWLWFGGWCWHFVGLPRTFMFPNMDSGKKNGVPIKGTLLVIWTHHALVSHLMQMDCVTRCWNSYIYFSWHVDSRELKRERDRAQSASLTHQEQKNERKRRHHGAYRMKNGITMRAESEISQQHTIDLTGMNPILPPSCLNKPTQCLTCSFFGSTHRDRSAVLHWWWWWWIGMATHEWLVQQRCWLRARYTYQQSLLVAMLSIKLNLIVYMNFCRNKCISWKGP